jgi:hypothetical protein
LEVGSWEREKHGNKWQKASFRFLTSQILHFFTLAESSWQKVSSSKTGVESSNTKVESIKVAYQGKSKKTKVGSV